MYKPTSHVLPALTPPEPEKQTQNSKQQNSNTKILFSETQKISKRIDELFENKRWTDIEFLVGTDDNKERFSAHKIILCSCSPVFEAMCFGPMAEKGIIEIPDINPDVFKELLSFIYSDHIVVTSPLTACQILYAAKKYLISGLSDLCKDYLNSNMRTEDVCLVYEYLKFIDETDLARNALDYISNNTSKIFSENSFLMLKSDTVKSILDQKSLAICSEKEVLDIALRWAEEECMRKNLENSGENLRTVLDPLLSSICFLSFKCDEFVSRKELQSIFTADEYCDVLCNLVKRNSCPLPPNIRTTPRICLGFSYRYLCNSGNKESTVDSNATLPFCLNGDAYKNTNTLFKFSGNE